MSQLPQTPSSDADPQESAAQEVPKATKFPSGERLPTKEPESATGQDSEAKKDAPPLPPTVGDWLPVAEQSLSNDEQLLCRLLADEKTPAAGTVDHPPPDAGPADMRHRLNEDLACIHLLRQVLPRRGSTEAHELSASSGRTPWPTLPGYEIQSVLGKGGMGVVYKARHAGLNRLVALKMLLHAAHALPQALDRFHLEAQAVARLRHVNIVQIYDIGESESGPYFSLEYIPGGSLAAYLDGTPLPGRLAAQLTGTLAEAMHYAHEHHIVHRDLKPGNILLHLEGEPSPAALDRSDPARAREATLALLARCVPKIADFGLARLVTDAPGRTHTGAVMGTPSYMPPEQAAGHNLQVGPLSDVYSLGAILYELLTGRPPFKGETMMDTLRQVTALEPVPLLRLNASLPADLQTICMKCLRKEPEKRYASAVELAADLRRFLNGEPIRARPVSLHERAIKWARRRPALASLLGFILLTVVASIAATAWHSVTLQTEIDRTNRERDRANEEKLNALSFSYASDMNLIQQDWATPRMDRMREMLERQIPEPGGIDLRGFEWHYWQRVAHSERATLAGHTDEVACIASSPDGKLLASGGSNQDPTVRLWDAATGRELAILATFNSPITTVAFIDEGRILEVVSWGGTVGRWNVANRKLLRTWKLKGLPIMAAAVPAKGMGLAVGRRDGSVEIWRLSEKTPRHVLRKPKNRQEEFPQVSAAAFSGDAKFLATGDYKGTLYLWDAETGKQLAACTGHRDVITGVSFSPAGERLATASNDGTVGLWDRNKMNERPDILIDHEREVKSVHFSPDGKKLVTAGVDGAVKLFHADGPPRFVLKGHVGAMRSAIFTPDGRTIVSAGSDRLIKLWDADRDPEKLTWTGHKRAVVHLAFTPDGSALATGGMDGAVKLWEPRTGRELAAPPPYPRPIRGLEFSRDGKHFAVVCLDNFIHIWDRQKVEEVDRLSVHVGGVSALAFSPDGAMLASGGFDSTVCVWDWRTRKIAAVCEGHKKQIQSLVFSPDGKLLASCDSEGALKLWEPASGRQRPTAAHIGINASCFAFSPEGSTLAIGSRSGSVRMWDLTRDRLIVELKGHLRPVNSLEFSPDGRTLASAGSEVKLWQTATGRELAVFTEVGGAASAGWSPDGHRLVCGGYTGVITVREAGNKGQ